MARTDPDNEVRRNGADGRHRGFLFRVERALLGGETAALLDDLRSDRRQPVDRPAAGSWTIGGDYWPTDGSWTPSPEIISVIGTPRFEQAFRSLSDSFEVYPLTNRRRSPDEAPESPD